MAESRITIDFFEWQMVLDNVHSVRNFRKSKCKFVNVHNLFSHLNER
jgi:hypothetical protein